MAKITKKMVIDGLKYVAENQKASNEQIQSHLREMGWTFSWEDFYRQFFLVKLFNLKASRGMRKGRIWAGANILMNLSDENLDDSSFARNYVADRFLLKDDNTSIYHFIRKVTKDKTYTKANLATN